MNVVKMLYHLLDVYFPAACDVLEHAAGGLFHFSAFYLPPHAIEPLVEVVKLRASAGYDSNNAITI